MARRLLHGVAQRLWGQAGRKGWPACYLLPVSVAPEVIVAWGLQLLQVVPACLQYLPASLCVLTMGPGGHRTDRSQGQARM